MKILEVRNVHDALPIGLDFLSKHGEKRESRNGPVLVAPYPVATVYEKPVEKVIFWKERDANPFFHLYESLWMLQGRNDVAPLERYVKKSASYSDDGKTLHGAYGFRWRGIWGDQLAIIADRLKKNPEDRRCILQMWHADEDLGTDSKDLPCNTIATFQRGSDGALNLTVFCRSNDIVWGAYGANAVQFGTLLEYMAHWIGCSVGKYTQISVNYHAYLTTYEQCKEIRPDRLRFIPNPYRDQSSHRRNAMHIPMQGTIKEMDESISVLLHDADNGFVNGTFHPYKQWEEMVYLVLKAHAVYKSNTGEDKYRMALKVLAEGYQRADWIVAATEWIQRRYIDFQFKQAMGGELTHP